MFVTTIANASVGLDWTGESLAVFTGLEWRSLVHADGGLLIWAFRALRPRAPRHAEASSGNLVPVQGVEATAWSNIPAVRFADVGGAARIKEEIGAIAKNRFGRNATGVVRNGILLHGELGTGKNLLAEATAGEFRVNFHHVRCPELMGVSIGSTSAEIRRPFEWVAAHRPTVLFLDEIDSIGSRKQPQGAGTDAGGGGREYNTVTTQLMQSIDQHRNLIMAATNYLDGPEPTLIREGRFDAKLRLGLPGEEGRKEIFAAQLARARGESTTCRISRGVHLVGSLRASGAWWIVRLCWQMAIPLRNAISSKFWKAREARTALLLTELPGMT